MMKFERQNMNLIDMFWCPEKDSLVIVRCLSLSRLLCLTSESVQGTSLALEGVDNVHGGDGLPLGVLSVGDGVPDNVLKEDLQNSTGLLVDESGDTLDSTSASQTTDSGLGDSLDVITQDLSVTLGASLSESFASFSSACHCRCMGVVEVTAMYLRRGLNSN